MKQQPFDKIRPKPKCTFCGNEAKELVEVVGGWACRPCRPEKHKINGTEKPILRMAKTVRGVVV